MDAADRRVPRRVRRAVYADRLIGRLSLWATPGGRPMCWAFDPLHLGPPFRPEPPPSHSRSCRRARRARSADAPGELGFTGGKAPEVGENARDPDARAEGGAEGVGGPAPPGGGHVAPAPRGGGPLAARARSVRRADAGAARGRAGSANLTNFGGGLTHLPPRARGLGRVTRWVAAKLVTCRARMNAREAPRPAA